MVIIQVKFGMEQEVFEKTSLRVHVFGTKNPAEKSFGIMGDQLMSPLKPLNTILL